MYLRVRINIWNLLLAMCIDAYDAMKHAINQLSALTPHWQRSYLSRWRDHRSPPGRSCADRSVVMERLNSSQLFCHPNKELSSYTVSFLGFDQPFRQTLSLPEKRISLSNFESAFNQWLKALIDWIIEWMIAQSLLFIRASMRRRRRYTMCPYSASYLIQTTERFPITNLWIARNKTSHH